LLKTCDVWVEIFFMSGDITGYHALGSDCERGLLSPVVRTLEQGHINKSSLIRKGSRAVRRFANLPIVGKKGVFHWFCHTSRYVFIFYALYSLLTFTFSDNINRLRAAWNITGTPYLVTPIQVIAAFLTGFSMNSAIGRFKSAMSALIALQNDVEHFRVCALATSHDPKIRVSVHCFIVWMLILVRKRIAFFTEDYSVPLRDLLDPLQDSEPNSPHDLSTCILFKPEVIFSFQSEHFAFITSHFLSAAKLTSKETQLDSILGKLLTSWKAIENLLQVRSPTTAIVLNRLVVHVWLMSVPLFADRCSIVALPFVASIWQALLSLAVELSDPWGHSFHDLPLDLVLNTLAAPNSHADKESIQSSIEWLNRGLTTDNWTCEDPVYPIPRQCRRGANKGANMDFDQMICLNEVAGYPTWEQFMDSASDELQISHVHHRRLAEYCRTIDARHISRPSRVLS